MATFTFTITSTADTAGDTSLGTFDDRGNGSGTLRQAINFANQFAGDPSAETVPITVQAGVTGTITLKSNLPLVAASIALDAGGLTLDGDSAHRGFLITGLSSGGTDAGPTTVDISNLTIQHVTAKGGDGGDFAGGGLGAGGAVFVGPAAEVTLTNVNIANTSAQGGGSFYNSLGYGGGGGLGGNGGNGDINSANANGGGGGILFAGGNGVSNGSGGGGAISSPGANGSSAGGGAGGSGVNGLGGGGDGGSQPYTGGDAGFGGGGGGGFNNPGGDGGFGGGGGAEGGDGGFGGGGGANFGGGKGGFGAGGGLNHLGSAGDPVMAQGGFAAGGQGGGGALGGAIFVAAGGNLTIAGTTSQTGGAVTGGSNLNVFSTQHNGFGSAYGAGIFYEGGTASASAPLTFGAGDQSFADQIADLNGAAGNTTTDNGLGGIGGVVALAKTGSGKLTLGGVNTYTGGTTVATGTISVAADTALGASSGGLTFKNGTLETTAGVTSARAVTVFGTATLQIDGTAKTTLSGVIVDGTVQTSGGPVTIPGTLVKTGAGTLVLSGVNTYSGGTTFSTGTIELGALGSAGSGAVTFGSGFQTLQIDISGTLANRLTGFGLGDVVDLRTISSDGASTSLTDNGGSFSLTVTEAASNGSDSNTLTFSGSISDYSFVISSDGAGGTKVALTLATPAAPMLATASDTGVSASDRITNDTTPTFTGSTVAGATVTLYDGSTAVGTATAGTDGTYSVTASTRSDGTRNFAITTAIGGSVSALSASTSVTIDATAPAAPSQPTLTAASDTGASSTDGITKVTKPTFTGTAEAGTRIALYRDNAVLVGTAAVATDGTWTIASTFAVADGRHSYYARAADKAGNVGVVSPISYVTVDTTLPAAATIALTAASDTGASTTDGITKISRPTVTGTTEAGATVLLYRDNAVLVGTAVAGATGSFSITPASALADGNHTLYVTVTDAAGNRSSGASNVVYVVIDTTAPAAPSMPMLTASSDTGASQTDGITKIAKPSVTGTAEAGTTVTLYRDNAIQIGSALVGSNGSYTITAGTALDDGVHNLYATTTDKAGNRSAGASPVQRVTIDTTVPMPTIDGGNRTVTSANQTITGTGEAGSTVTLTDNGTAAGTATVASNGSWSKGVTLSSGNHRLVATDVDKAGNTGTSGAINLAYTPPPAGARQMASLNSMVQAMSMMTPSSSATLTTSAPSAPHETHLAAAHA